MKNILPIILASFLLGLSTLGNKSDLTALTATSSSQPEADLSFAVLGDVHDDISHLEQAIKDLHGVNPKMDALILNGDTVDQGVKRQYDSLTELLLRYKGWLPETIIKNIGNHEFFDYTIKQNTADAVHMFIKRYLEFAGEKKVYHDRWIKGYHFISLGSEDGNSRTLNSIKAYISQTQCQWLKGKLAENYALGKPIFVFLHQPLNSNPKRGWVGSDQADEIRKILSGCPEVILFTSHTHADLTDKSVDLNQPFTTVYTGAVHYTIVRVAQRRSGMREPLIKGLYIEVNKNQVVIKGRDLKKDSWIFAQEINSYPRGPDNIPLRDFISFSRLGGLNCSDAAEAYFFHTSYSPIRDIEQRIK